ncbi:unnamed protein product [Didymodactylos carnosus]|uniref:Uncharacterized protein n=1 Tax=Didymodactylos carnosus TaxID=1234261 RepID=A0A814M550_9BILA|nr:unnamed protein product [Didymodactylos carnosus]CAF3840252.1 unnamed protein product [Didymodactylos carnosus]
MLKLSFRCGNELKDNVQLSVNTKESILNLEKQYFKNSDPAFDEFTLVSVGYQKNDEWCNIIETNFDQSMHNLKMPENSTILYTYKIPEQAKVTENVEPPYDDPNDVNMCESDTTINDQDNNLPSYCPPEPDPLQEKSKAEGEAELRLVLKL